VYILDSDIFSLAYTITNPNIPLRTRIARAGKNNIFLSIVTVKESCRGALGLIGRYNRDQEPRLVSAYDLFEKVLRSISTLHILPFDNECYALHGNERLTDARRRRPEDSRIAATALRFNFVLVTRNEHHYEGIPNLQIENWMDNPRQPEQQA
jgi:predicted nucleic acid-binding protein